MPGGVLKSGLGTPSGPSDPSGVAEGCRLLSVKNVCTASFIALILVSNSSFVAPGLFRCQSSYSRNSSWYCFLRSSDASLSAGFVLLRYNCSSMLFLDSMRSFCSASSLANRSASSTIRSISSLDKRPLSFVIAIFCDLPVDFSQADTFKMPLASISNTTSICGIPRGIGGMPSNWNLPNRVLSFVMARSPSNTWIMTPGWLSEYVEKICDFLIGIVLLRLIILVMTPPAVSRPRLRGHTSKRSRSEILASWAPVRMAAWTAAP